MAGKEIPIVASAVGVVAVYFNRLGRPNRLLSDHDVWLLSQCALQPTRLRQGAQLKCKEGEKEQNLFFALFALFASFASLERLAVPGRRRDGPRVGQLSLDVFLFPSLLTEVAFLALASAMTGAWLT